MPDNPYAGVTVRQSDDQTPLTEVYPLRDVAALTDDQERALEDATRAAMRTLVEAGWARRGVTRVRWASQPRYRMSEIIAGGVGAIGENARHELAGDLAHDEVAVWGEAYDALDADRFWTEVTTR